MGSYSACGGSDSGTTYTPVKADFGYSITCLTTGPGGSTRSNALIYSAATVSACVEQLDIGALSDGGVAALTGTKAGWAFTQGTGSKQPVKAANALNSLPGITADGSDDFLSASVNLTSYSALRIVAAVVDTTGASVTSVIVEHTASFGSNDGAFALGTYFDGVTSDTLGAGARGSGAAGFTRAGESLASACVISSNFDTSLSAGSSFIRKNGSALSTTAVLGTCGAGAFANASMYLFMRAGTSLPWAGTVGRKVLFLSGAAQDATLTDAEYYVMNGNGL